MHLYTLNNFTANNTDQNQPIFPISKDDITKELNLKPNEIEITKPENTYEDEKPSEEDCEPLLCSSQTPEEITPNSQQKSDEGTTSTQLFDGLEIALNTAEQDNKNNEEDKDNAVDKNSEDKDRNDKYQEHHKEREDQENTAEAKTNMDMESIIDAVQKLSREGDVRKTITILDFAGQSIYYAFHQIYLSRATFALLVVDMSKGFEDFCKPTNVSDDDFCCSRFESWTYNGNKI